MNKFLQSFRKKTLLVVASLALVFGGFFAASAQTTDIAPFVSGGATANFTRIGSLAIGVPPTPASWLYQQASYGGSTPCINKDTLADGRNLTGKETCLSVMKSSGTGVALFDRVNSSIESYSLGKGIVSRTVGAVSYLNPLNLTNYFFVGDTSGTADSISVHGLFNPKRGENNDPNKKRFLCASQRGTLYPCAQEEPTETYRWDFDDWGDCSVANSGICSGQYTTPSGGSCSGDYNVTQTTTIPGSCTGKYIDYGNTSGTTKKLDWNGKPFSWVAGHNYYYFTEYLSSGNTPYTQIDSSTRVPEGSTFDTQGCYRLTVENGVWKAYSYYVDQDDQFDHICQGTGTGTYVATLSSATGTSSSGTCSGTFGYNDDPGYGCNGPCGQCSEENCTGTTKAACESSGDISNCSPSPNCKWTPGTSSPVSQEIDCPTNIREEECRSQDYDGCVWRDTETVTTTTPVSCIPLGQGGQSDCEAKGCTWNASSSENYCSGSTESICKASGPSGVCNWTAGTESTQTRAIRCLDSKNQVVADTFCLDQLGPDSMPIGSRSCQADWVAENWGSCVNGEKTRNVYCPTGKVCDPNTKPETTTTVGCLTYSWQESGWGSCSTASAASCSGRYTSTTTSGTCTDDVYIHSTCTNAGFDNCNEYCSNFSLSSCPDTTATQGSSICIKTTKTTSQELNCPSNLSKSDCESKGCTYTAAGNSTQTQTVSCVASNGTTVADTFCSGTKPAEVRSCTTTPSLQAVRVTLTDAPNTKTCSTYVGTDSRNNIYLEYNPNVFTKNASGKLVLDTSITAEPDIRLLTGSETGFTVHPDSPSWAGGSLSYTRSSGSGDFMFVNTGFTQGSRKMKLNFSGSNMTGKELCPTVNNRIYRCTDNGTGASNDSVWYNTGTSCSADNVESGRTYNSGETVCSASTPDANCIGRGGCSDQKPGFGEYCACQTVQLCGETTDECIQRANRNGECV